MSIPSGNYASIMNSFFGYLSAAERQALWETYLTQHGLPLNTTPTDNVTGNTSFVQFIQGQYSTVQDLVLSPEEVVKRTIVFDTFDLVLKMLSVLQNTVAVQANNLIFFGKWQSEYTKMLTRVPIYIPTPINQWSPTSGSIDLYPDNVTDATRFTIGFNNLTVQEMAEYAVSVFIPGDGQRLALANNPSGPLDNPLAFYMSANEVTFNYFTTSPFTLAFATTVNAGILPGDTFDQKVKKLSDAFLAVYNDPQVQFRLENQAFVSDPARSPRINWTYFGTDTERQQTRGEVNAKNQQIIENIRSKRQTLKDQASQVESNLSQSREAISQQANLLTSIMESLKSLISAIFK